MPSHSMANPGAGPLSAGRTNSARIYSCQPDTNPAEIHWYAVPLGEKNMQACTHSW